MEKYFVNQRNHNSVTIGGVRRLKEFSPTELIIGVAGAEIRVIGEKLKLASFHQNEINIAGKISNVETIKTATRGAG